MSSLQAGGAAGAWWWEAGHFGAGGGAGAESQWLLSLSVTHRKRRDSNSPPTRCEHKTPHSCLQDTMLHPEEVLSCDSSAECTLRTHACAILLSYCKTQHWFNTGGSILARQMRERIFLKTQLKLILASNMFDMFGIVTIISLDYFTGNSLVV